MQWCELLGIKKMESPVYHPRAKGLAERSVQTVKQAFQAWTPNLKVSIGAKFERTDDALQHFKDEGQNAS